MIDSDKFMVTLLSKDSLTGAANTMSTAFHNDPLWQYLYPDEKIRQQTLRKFFRAILALSIDSQQAYGVGALPAGVAVWNIPGQSKPFPSFPTILQLLLLVLSSFALAAYRARTIFSQFERMQKMYAPDPHLYLQTVGVHPDFHRQGLSSQLIRPFLEKADLLNLGTYTETMTPSNVSLYEHFGFVCVEKYMVPKTQLCLWAFYRAAPAARSRP
jgi:GNAT superfamily N-acetyltransferase